MGHAGHCTLSVLSMQAGCGSLVITAAGADFTVSPGDPAPERCSGLYAGAGTVRIDQSQRGLTRPERIERMRATADPACGETLDTGIWVGAWCSSGLFSDLAGSSLGGRLVQAAVVHPIVPLLWWRLISASRPPEGRFGRTCCSGCWTSWSSGAAATLG
jgi:hypothetical protein